MANRIIDILIYRDKMSESEASEKFREMRDRLTLEGEDPTDLLHEIGLESDYIMDLI
jgi:hypothetical protein